MPKNVPGCLMITGCKMYIYKVHWELLLVVFFTSETSHQTHNRWHSTDGPMSRLDPSCSGCRNCCWRCAAWPWPRPPCPPPASTARSASTRCTASAGSWRTAPMTLRWHSTLDHSPFSSIPVIPLSGVPEGQLLPDSAWPARPGLLREGPRQQLRGHAPGVLYSVDEDLTRIWCLQMIVNHFFVDGANHICMAWGVCHPFNAEQLIHKEPRPWDPLR